MCARLPPKVHCVTLLLLQGRSGSGSCFCSFAAWQWYVYEPLKETLKPCGYHQPCLDAVWGELQGWHSSASRGSHPVAGCKMLLMKQKQNSCSNCFIIDSSTDCPKSSHCICSHQAVRAHSFSLCPTSESKPCKGGLRGATGLVTEVLFLLMLDWQ